MKAVKLAHRFGCVGYTLLAAVISFAFFPLAYLIHSTGSEETIALLSYAVMGLAGALVAVVVLLYKVEFWLAAAIWLPEVFVCLMAYMISFTFFSYRLANNRQFDQWAALFLNLVTYQAVILGWYGLSAYREGTGVFAPKAARAGKRQNIPRLIRHLSHRNPDVRKDAAAALASHPDPRAVEPLIAAMHAEMETGQYSNVLGWIISALAKSNDRRAFEPLNKFLHSKNVLSIPTAMDGMVQLDGGRAVLALAEALQNEIVYIRAEAAVRLGSLKDPGAVPALADALHYQPDERSMNQYDRDQLRRLRVNAASALHSIGTPEAVDALLAALQGENLDVSAQAALQLGYLKAERAVPYLSAAMGYANLRTFGGGELEQRAALQMQAAAALARIGTPEAQQAIADRFSETYHWHKVAEALASVGQNVIPAVQAWIALWKLDRPAVEALGGQATPALLYALKYADRAHQMFASRILGRQGHPEAFATLRRILDDEGEINERLQVVELLEEIGGAQAIAVLEVAAQQGGVMREEYYLSYEKVQRAAIQAIRRLEGASQGEVRSAVQD